MSAIKDTQAAGPERHQPLVDRLTGATAEHLSPPSLTVHEVGRLLGDTLAVLFPHFRGGATSPTVEQVDEVAGLARTMIAKVTRNRGSAHGSVEDLVDGYLNGLPDIAEIATVDAAALLDFDPAAHSFDEIILAYPGFRATVAYRLAHRLLKAEVPLLPRLITEFAHRKTGIDIHPGATIGRAFCIDHGTAIVIGETAVIGDNVKLYQGVTLGGLSVKKSNRGRKRHPTLEDNVVVYAGATILGGGTIVGHDSVIGGNVWLTRSVPPWSRVMFKPCDTEEIIPESHRSEGANASQI